MQEQNPDTVLEQQTAASEPEDQVQEPAADIQQPAQAAAPAAEEAPVQPDEPAVVTVVDIRFRNNAKSYYFDPAGLTLMTGAHVIIDTARGDEFGVCAAGNHPVKPRELVLPLRKVLRVATEQDERTNAENQEREKKAFEICQQKIAAHGLEMQLVSAECAFDGSKLLFFFTADGRVDFRELVKDLASVFRTRIELRQIGVRDKAKMVGGLGVCGRPFCCKEFLDDFQPVSIKMAKTQNLSLNPTKISGTCGRLMCCLKYEQDAYEDAVRRMPKNESFVQTPDGPGNVSAVNLLKEQVTVRLDSQPDAPRCYHNCEVCVLRNSKGSRDGIQVPQERPARLVAEEKQEDFPAVVSDFHFTPPEAVSAALNGEKEEGRASRNRRRRGGRGHSGDEERSAEKKPAEQAEKQSRIEKSRPPRRRGGKRPEGGTASAAQQPKPQPPKVQQPKSQPGTGDPAAAKKSRHRGGRRHSRRSGAGGSGKTEA